MTDSEINSMQNKKKAFEEEARREKSAAEKEVGEIRRVEAQVSEHKRKLLDIEVKEHQAEAGVQQMEAAIKAREKFLEQEERAKKEQGHH